MYPYADEDPYPDDDRHTGDAFCPREYHEPPAFPLDPLDISLARIEMARRIGKGPVSPDLEYARSLWVAFAGEWGIWTRAAIPIEDEIGTGDKNRIARACALAAELISHPECYGCVIAAIVLRRPGPPKPGAADRRIFRLIASAAAARDTVPWSFYIAGPEDFRPLGSNPPGASRNGSPRRLSRMGRYPTVTSCYTRSYEP
jgi:hypothetical protein